MELDHMLCQWKEKLWAAGIPVSAHLVPQVKINTRAKRRLGCCIRREGRFTIELSQVILGQEQLVEKTLVHELLHTCPDSYNHGVRWKAYAAQIEVLFGLSISRTEEVGEAEDGLSAASLRQEVMKYLLVCQSCGRELPRSRMSKAVKYPSRYRCSCGGKLKRVR